MISRSGIPGDRLDLGGQIRDLAVEPDPFPTPNDGLNGWQSMLNPSAESPASGGSAALLVLRAGVGATVTRRWESSRRLCRPFADCLGTRAVTVQVRFDGVKNELAFRQHHAADLFYTVR